MKTEMVPLHNINLFWPNAPFLYPMKMPENLWFSDVFKGIKRKHWAKTGWKRIFKTLRPNFRPSTATQIMPCPIELECKMLVLSYIALGLVLETQQQCPTITLSCFPRGAASTPAII